MKEYANNFKTQFSSDAKILDQIQNEQETNIRKTQAERDRLHKLQKSSMWGFWTKLILLIAGAAVFVAMLWFIWLFPSRVYHYKS